ncbi:MAG: crossover junction endodeoxyribonuclease RuvC [Caldilineae bacterium]|nr:MAG: crossover junction endodeoxyribonuclease RuvC [Caldilineae bacterium]
MSSRSEIVLGIDPGTAITGYGLVSEQDGELQAIAYGVIRTPAEDPLRVRLVQIYDALRELIRHHKPAAAAVEELFFARNARTALSVGHARGVVLLAVAQSNLPLFHYKPAQVKQAVTGYGGADKQQVQEMVRMLLGLDERPQPDDAADALAVAICHIHSTAMLRLGL